MTTRLGPSGVPRPPYGSFAGKATAAPAAVGEILDQASLMTILVDQTKAIQVLLDEDSTTTILLDEYSRIDSQ